MISFKSKYSNLESVLKDKNYCKWLMTTGWFKNKVEYEAVKNHLKKLNQFVNL